ncbi:MAG TPA: DUF2780 domain-containing protein [Candidatus Sulfotelmatobacter sp.]|nr:DUF2780 domain-containing protein [Candidatus Sulfotelmatobacter sp.]
MKRTVVTLSMLAMLVSTGCTKNSTSSAMSSVTSLASNPLISSLTSSLGLSATQAIGGAGALLGLAQKNLAGADWSKVAGAIPGASSLISEAKSLGGISKFTDLAGLSSAFSKMGLTGDQVKSVSSGLTDFVSKAAGPDLGTKLAGAIK